jgi:3-deoxy-D-manno-octulosonic-acid transferase
MIEPLYRGLTRAAAPALLLWLKRRERQGKEEAARLDERRGIPGRTRPDGRLVWLHAASVGEAVSVLPLIERLRIRWPEVTILVTTGTVTSAQILAGRLPSGCIHQYVPLDVPGWIGHFLDHWRPGAVLWVESELWPNTIAEIRRRQVPLALINARLSPRSFARWRAVAPLLRAPLDAFEFCLAQDEATASRLSALGARSVQCLGNLKFDAEPLPADEAELAALRTALHGRPLWCAASTQPGEAEAVLAAHRRLAAQHEGLLTIIVPRHATRGRDIAELCRAADIRAVQRSLGAKPASDVDVYIADTMGELGLFYRLARIAFIGGSLVPHGGQNVLEAARLDTALVFGPHMHNFPEVSAALIDAGGAEQVADGEALAAAVERLLTDAKATAARAAAARRVADTGRGTVARVADALAPLFERLGSPAAVPLQHARA